MVTKHTEDEETWARFRLAHAWLYAESYKASEYWPYNIPAIKVR